MGFHTLLRKASRKSNSGLTRQDSSASSSRLASPSLPDLALPPVSLDILASDSPAWHTSSPSKEIAVVPGISPGVPPLPTHPPFTAQSSPAQSELTRGARSLATSSIQRSPSMRSTHAKSVLSPQILNSPAHSEAGSPRSRPRSHTSPGSFSFTPKSMTWSPPPALPAFVPIMSPESARSPQPDGVQAIPINGSHDHQPYPFLSQSVPIAHSLSAPMGLSDRASRYQSIYSEGPFSNRNSMYIQQRSKKARNVPALNILVCGASGLGKVSPRAPSYRAIAQLPFFQSYQKDKLRSHPT